MSHIFFLNINFLITCDNNLFSVVEPRLIRIHSNDWCIAICNNIAGNVDSFYEHTRAICSRLDHSNGCCGQYIIYQEHLLSYGIKQ